MNSTLHLNQATLAELTVRLKQTMGPEAHSPETAVFVLEASRLIARGKPVSVSQIAEQLSLDDSQIELCPKVVYGRFRQRVVLM